MERRDALIVIAVAISAFAIGFSVANMYWYEKAHFMQESAYHPSLQPTAQYKSNGEMIYVSGVNEKGERILFVGGPNWLYMHGGGCASCHGLDGKGGVYPMMCGVKTPDIRYSTLTKEHGMSDEDIKRAITKGIGDEGEELDYCMPRWQMSEKDINDLIEYLKQLG